MISSILRFILIAAAVYFLIVSVKFVRIMLTVLVGIVYIPLNTLNTVSQKWYFKIKHKDVILYYLYTPIYWLLVGITFVISIPYEFLITEGIH